MEAEDEEAAAHEVARARSHQVLDIDLRTPSNNALESAPSTATESDAAATAQSSRGGSKKATSRAADTLPESEGQAQKQTSPAGPSQPQAKILKLSINGACCGVRDLFKCRKFRSKQYTTIFAIMTSTNTWTS
jgi:hypothetical protein